MTTRTTFASVLALSSTSANPERKGDHEVTTIAKLKTCFGKREARFRYKSLRHAVAADHKAVDLSLRLFHEAQTDFLSVLTAQRMLYTDDSNLTQSRETLGTDLIAPAQTIQF